MKCAVSNGVAKQSFREKITRAAGAPNWRRAVGKGVLPRKGGITRDSQKGDGTSKQRKKKKTPHQSGYPKCEKIDLWGLKNGEKNSRN